MTNEQQSQEQRVSVFELREVASGRIAYGAEKYHLALLARAADEIDRLQRENSELRLKLRDWEDWLAGACV